MGSNERTTLRIRCGRDLFREFKRVAVDYDSYEEALRMLIEAYRRYLKTYPEFPRLKKRGPGKYQVTA